MGRRRDTGAVKKCPFTILIDTAESLPYAFNDIRGDASENYKLFDVNRHWSSLGRHPNSYGDYTILGGYQQVAVERKSMEDAWGTILGWPTGWEQDRNLVGRRERFKGELANLNEVPSSLVVVEASLGRCLARMPQWGKKSAETNAKIFLRSVLSFQQEFSSVQWMFADSRRLAEVYTFRWLYRHWRNNKDAIKEITNAELRHGSDTRGGQRELGTDTGISRDSL